jgi:hypothetical protein
MLLYRFRIWKTDEDIKLDDDVYTHEIADDKIQGFHQPNQVYRVIVPAENKSDPVLHVIFSDNKEKMIEYVRGFGMAMEIIPSNIPINIYKNPFRVAKPNEELFNPDGVK